MPINDTALWATVIKDIKPLKRLSATLPTSKSSQLKIIEQNPSRVSGFSTELTDRKLELGSYAGVDNNLRKQMDNGNLPIEGKLDLHGMRVNEAFCMFTAFIEESYAQDKRMLLIITGKGHKSTNGSSIIKAELPNWLNHEGIRRKILRFSFAQIKHGGVGAFYVLLKRKRAL